MKEILSEKQINVLVDEFYTTSIEDIVGLFAISQAVEDLTGNVYNNLVREQALRVVEGLLDRGMVAGDSPYHPGGYQLWASQERSVVMDRIRSEWVALGQSPSIPDIAWFGPPE